MNDASRRGIAYRTALGAVWLIGSGLLAKSVDLITLLFLARILTPADFGLVAVAMSLVFIVEAVLEIPLHQGLVRLPEVTRDHLETVFTLATIRGLAVGTILAASALPFAAVYGDPRLAPIICVLGVAPAARGLTSPRMAEFAKRISFHRDFAIEVSGKLVALVTAVTMALNTHSYWSIVAGTVANPLTMVAVSFMFAPFRPRLSLREWRAHLGFLGWSSASQVVNALNWQCDRLILGRFTAPRVLGAFAMANDLATLPERTLIKTLVRPTMGAFTLLKGDIVRLREAYATTTAGAMAVGLPTMLGLALLAEPTVHCVLGTKWLPAIPILKWLAYSSIPPLFTVGLAPVVMTLNQTRVFLSRSIWELLIKLPLVAAGAIWFGVGGVIVARITTDIAMAVISMSLANELIGVSLTRQVLSCWRIIAGGGALAAALLLLRPLLDTLHGTSLFLGLVGVAAIGMTVYLACVAILWLGAGRPAGIEAMLMGAVRGRFAARTAATS